MTIEEKIVESGEKRVITGLKLSRKDTLGVEHRQRDKNAIDLHSEIRVTLVESITDFHLLRDEWNCLLRSSGSESIFLTWEWLSAWIETFMMGDRRLFILLFYNGDELVGGAPWYQNETRTWIGNLRTIEFIGTPETSSDYLDVVVKSGWEKKISQVLRNYLFKKVRGLWDLCKLKYMRSDSVFLLFLLEGFREAGYFIDVELGPFCPIIKLPGTKEEFLKNLSGKRRRRYLREQRILEKKGGLEFISLPIRQSQERFGAFFKIYENRWGKNFELYSFLKKLAEKFGEKDNVRLETIESDGSVIGGITHLTWNETQYMYLFATDKNFNQKISVGNILVGLSIERALQEGIRIFDFLKGSEEYKFYWAKTGKRLVNVEFPSRGLPLKLYEAVRFVKKGARVLY